MLNGKALCFASFQSTLLNLGEKFGHCLSDLLKYKIWLLNQNFKLFVNFDLGLWNSNFRWLYCIFQINGLDFQVLILHERQLVLQLSIKHFFVVIPVFSLAIQIVFSILVQLVLHFSTLLLVLCQFLLLRHLIGNLFIQQVIELFLTSVDLLL